MYYVVYDVYGTLCAKFRPKFSISMLWILLIHEVNDNVSTCNMIFFVSMLVRNMCLCSQPWDRSSMILEARVELYLIISDYKGNHIQEDTLKEAKKSNTTSTAKILMLANLFKSS